jgi:hypothetical protein
MYLLDDVGTLIYNTRDLRSAVSLLLPAFDSRSLIDWFVVEKGIV